MKKYFIRRPGQCCKYSSSELKKNTFEAEGEHVLNYNKGEHVAVFWQKDDGGFRWYLGVVNELCKNKDGNKI